MADDDPWTAWSRDVNRKLARHEKRLATHGEQLDNVLQATLTLYEMDRHDKGLPPLEKPKPRHRVKAGTGASW